MPRFDINSSPDLPHLRGDIKSCLDTLEKDTTGITDPFESIYRVVYQLTMRMVGCDDIAEDPELLEKTLQLYETVENSATPTVGSPLCLALCIFLLNERSADPTSCSPSSFRGFPR